MDQAPRERMEGLAVVGKAGAGRAPSCPPLIWETLSLAANVLEFPRLLCPWAFSMFAVSEPREGWALHWQPQMMGYMEVDCSFHPQLPSTDTTNAPGAGPHHNHKSSPPRVLTEGLLHARHHAGVWGTG